MPRVELVSQISSAAASSAAVTVRCSQPTPHTAAISMTTPRVMPLSSCGPSGGVASTPAAAMNTLLAAPSVTQPSRSRIASDAR